MRTFQAHLQSPEITLDQHIRWSQIALGQSLSDKKAVYLDTKYWILLRDANKASAAHRAVDLLNLLRSGVAANILFCPISESVFLELMKQSDPASRLATAALIDELSQGVTLIEEDRRLAAEIAHFMYSKSGRSNLHPIEHLVWSKLSFVLGVTYPTNTGFDPATELAIQKAFFDHMWAMPLREIVTTIAKLDVEVSSADLANIATVLNTGIAAHSEELSTFREAYAAEVQGMVDIATNAIVDVVLMMAKEAGVVSEPTQQERIISERQFKQLFILVLTQNRARELLPTMHIQASMHASVRWDKSRKFRGNDLFDFNHATAALSYCDAFLTERSLHTLITQKHLALDRLYNCRVASEIEVATELVRELTSRS